MEIPLFPNSRPIALQDKSVFDRLFEQHPPELSAYTFTNLYGWAEPYETEVSAIGDSIIVLHRTDGKTLLLEPLGPPETTAAVIRRCLEMCGSRAEFGRISASVAAELADDSTLQVAPNRDDFDYLYSTQDLIHLHGRKFDAKRNFINRFKSEYEYDYIKLDAAGAQRCAEFAHRWCEDRLCDSVEGLRKEQCAVYRMLTHFEELGIVGGAIAVAGEVVAFELGEPLNPKTMVIHVEKADSAVAGLYQVINNEFCIHEASTLEFVNREQDLGVPGLRKAKESYHPVRLVEAWTVSLA